MNTPAKLAAVAAVILLVGSWTKDARADSRRFAWSYESTGSPAGLSEYEQWATWKTDKSGDERFERLEFRQEFEHGLTDRLQVGFYFANWRYTRTAEGSDTEVRSSSLELIYNLRDPMTSALGVAIYGEVTLGPQVCELEGKLLLEKNLGPLVLVANSILEAAWEDEDWGQDEGKFEQTLGLSRQLSPKLLFGAEALYEVAFPDWSDTGESLFYAGPTASVRSRGWWLTPTPLLQLSDQSDQPDLMWRTLVGVPF